MQAILYQFKRDLAAWKRLHSGPPARAANIVANNGNALLGV